MIVINTDFNPVAKRTRS